METDIDFETFSCRLVALLRAQPVGTTADLTDAAVAFWDGGQLVCALRPEEELGTFDDVFELKLGWYNWKATLLAWLSAPTFTKRAVLVAPELPRLTRRACTSRVTPRSRIKNVVR